MLIFSEIYPYMLLGFTFLMTGYVLVRTKTNSELQATNSRDFQIDGFRSLLAFLVIVWHYFIQRDLILMYAMEWGGAPQVSKIVLNSGSWSVQMFFGITGYLFTHKLANSRSKNIDWLAFFIGRIFRLVPVCLICASVLFLISPQSYGHYVSSTSNYKWLLHIVNLGTSSIRQGVSPFPSVPLWEHWVSIGPHWTLHYEWFFYALLPLISIFFRTKQKLLWFVMALVLVTVVMKNPKEFFASWSYVTWAFIPGMLLGMSSKFCKESSLLRHPITAALAITLVTASAFVGTLKVKLPTNMLLLAVIISKNSLTRFFESKLLCSLGETTYSIYLLHCLVQYVTLKWVVTPTLARSMPEWLWWMTCAIQVIVIVVIGRLSFEYVEKPGIEAGKRFYTWLMKLIERRVRWLLNWI